MYLILSCLEAGPENGMRARDLGCPDSGQEEVCQVGKEEGGEGRSSWNRRMPNKHLTYFGQQSGLFFLQ